MNGLETEYTRDKSSNCDIYVACDDVLDQAAGQVLDNTCVLAADQMTYGVFHKKNQVRITKFIPE